MNKRELFERVRDHLTSQMQKSLSSMGLCAYRGEGGLKCAIGCLIDDKHYADYIEEKTVGHGYVQAALIASGVQIETVQDVAFLARLQSIHDELKPSEWGRALDSIYTSSFLLQ